MIRVVLADDQALLRAGLRVLLDAEDDLEVVGEAEDGDEAIATVRRLRPDVVGMDIRMPDLDGPALYREIERRWPERAERVVFVTGDTLGSTLREFVAESGRPVIEKPFLPSDVRSVVAAMPIPSPSEARQPRPRAVR